MVEVPPPLPLPPLVTPSLSSLFPGDPSLSGRSMQLSAIGHTHPGQSLLDASVPHRTPSQHSITVGTGGAGGTITRRVRTPFSDSVAGAGVTSSTAMSSTSTSFSSSRAAVQPHAVPRSFQVFEPTPLFGVAAEHTKYRVEYDQLEQRWHKVLFPSLAPSSEKDVMMLEEWMNEQLAPFALRGGGTGGMSMTDVGFCLQVYNVGLNEIYRQTAIQSRRRARVLEGVWRGYVELLEHTRAADGGAVREDMELMKREMAANERQTELAMQRSEAEETRYTELKRRFDALVADVEAAKKEASGSTVKLEIQNFTNARQRRMMGREVRLKERADRDRQGAQNAALQKEVDLAELRQKYLAPAGRPHARRLHATRALMSGLELMAVLNATTSRRCLL
jgi:hypothetical protein